MGWLRKLLRQDAAHDGATSSRRSLKRRCRIEKLQDRRPMAADIHLGAVYYEDTTDGEDTTPDVIDITWVGGPAGAELKQLTLNMDKNGNGVLDPGETFFDTAGVNFGVGQFGNADLQLTANGFTILSVSALGGSGVPGDWDGATGIVLTFAGYNAGEHLILEVDIDEQGFMNSASALVEGDEFQYSKIAASFEAPHYKPASGEGVFLDEYPDAKADVVGLPRDNYTVPPALPVPLRTAGAFIDVTPIPLGSIKGNVHADYDGDCLVDPGEPLLEGVTIELLDAQGNVIGTTLTDVNGNYEFLDLEAGVYGVREIQPTDYFNGGTLPGQINGVTVGTSPIPNVIAGIQLAAGDQSVENNFCEKFGSISGRVHADVDEDCDYEPQLGDVPIAGVTIELLDAQGNVIATTTTDAEGKYKFDKLLVGTYSVREIQPAVYFDGGQDAGTIDGIIVGVESNDRIDQIALIEGRDGINYDFCERFGSISGRVHVDIDGDCEFEPNMGDTPIAGVTIQLLNENGVVIDVTTTDANGQYSFNQLLIGTYSVREIQPVAYFDGGQDAGTINGIIVGVESNDRIDDITLQNGGRHAVDYDFCERLGSISGRVHVDIDGDCEFEPNEGDTPIAGVTIELLNANGVVIAVTTTDANGQYLFDHLLTGTYSVREVQPANFFNGGKDAGTINGIVVGTESVNRIDDITLYNGGRHAIDYDFCERLGSIRGRVIVDVNGNNIVDAPKETPIAGVTIQLLDAAGNVIATTTTDDDGRYLFDNLQRGTYAVRELQPTEYFDGRDYVGYINGVQVGVQPTNDLLSNIALLEGRHGVLYDFTERVTQPPFITYNPPDPIPPFKPAPLFAPPISPVQNPLLIPNQPAPDYYSSGIVGFTWHLSVVNGGQPRTPRMTQSQLVAREREIGEVMNERPDWNSAAVRQGKFTLRTGDEDQAVDRELEFGVDDGIPVVGDFNGDGNADVGVFRYGAWFIDLNGNGEWDEGDLWAKLGKQDDLPVTGDWDGDGKADIAIFGRAWPGDPRHVAAEPGLPSDINAKHGKAKNVPPDENEATLGIRALQFTSAGKVRADLIDHVFLYGWGGDLPISGDWTGEGQEMIGIFRDGSWKLDLNGDGIYDEHDRVLDMGETGDKPVIGDFNGDTRIDLGIYRNGFWHIDVNNDGVLDARDRAFTFGDGADQPVVGDWDGDGVDDPGLYRNTGPSGG